MLDALARVEDILRWAAVATPPADFAAALQAAEGTLVTPATEVGPLADPTSTDGWVSRLPAQGRRWASAIEEAARRHGLHPALLAALVWAESSFRPEAVSDAGAIGLTQLMPQTAAGLGVDPRDPLENLEGGARYLAAQIRRFGSVELGLAAYRAGPAAVAAAGGIPSAGTRAYVERVLGYAEALTGPAAVPTGPSPATRAVPQERSPGGVPVPSRGAAARSAAADEPAVGGPPSAPPTPPAARAPDPLGGPPMDRSSSVGPVPAGDADRAGRREGAAAPPSGEPSAPVEVPGSLTREAREAAVTDRRGTRAARVAPSSAAASADGPGEPTHASAPGTGARLDPTAPAARETGSAGEAAARVVELVERLRDAAPPRRMAVELPELGGLRLLLEARGTTIHVRPLGGDPVWFDALVRDLGPSLAARGFDLAGSPGRDPREPDEPPPRGEVRALRRRTKEGMRI